MDEAPENHDFDQRHDGPFDQPRPSVQISPDARSPSGAISFTNPPHTNSDSPVLSPTGGRKSMQASRKGSGQDPKSPPPRTSTQLSRPGRPSRDFDTRLDGPYGRPSLTMSRRRSSGINNLPTEPEDDRPVLQSEDEDRGRPIEPIPDPEAPSVETLQSSNDAAFEPEPPPLNYDIWKRKWHIVIFWGLIVIDCVFMPITLYFCLHYFTSLSPNTLFSIVTAALGGVSIIEYCLRFWRLWKKNSTVRVIGARRAYLDWFHWNFSLGWTIIMVELIVGTIPKNPPIRLLAMPVASMLYAFGTELLIVDILRYFEVPAPCRISSIPKGSQLRPCIYSVIEDVVAVDGSGGTEYREALNKRYEASHVFRAMLRRLGVFWAVGAEGMAIVVTILVFTINDEAAYAVGWAAPFIWAAIWAMVTYWYVCKMLKLEQTAWAQELAAKNSA